MRSSKEHAQSREALFIIFISFNIFDYASRNVSYLMLDTFKGYFWFNNISTLYSVHLVRKFRGLDLVRWKWNINMGRAAFQLIRASGKTVLCCLLYSRLNKRIGRFHLRLNSGLFAIENIWIMTIITFYKKRLMLFINTT